MNKNVKIPLLIFIITVAGLISISFIAAATPSEPKDTNLNTTLLGIVYSHGPVFSGDGNELDLNLLEPGDILITQGYPAYFPGAWSHTLLYIGNGLVIESGFSGVTISDLSIVHEFDACSIIRVDTSRTVKNKAIKEALYRFGKGSQLITSPYMGYKDPYESLYYCSELIWAAYKVNGVEIDSNPFWSLLYGFHVAPEEIVNDDDTFLVAFSA
jgi:uncharacterized protein YycO